MSETSISNGKSLEGRDRETGRFVAGYSGGGRPKGSRNRLTTQFLDDVLHEWERSGKAALAAMVETDPVKFVQVCANLIPAKIENVLTVDSELFRDVADFAQAYQIAREAIGLDRQKLIEAEASHGE